MGGAERFNSPLPGWQRNWPSYQATSGLKCCHVTWANTDVPVCKSFAGKEQTVGSIGLWNQIVIVCIAVLLLTG